MTEPTPKSEETLAPTSKINSSPLKNNKEQDDLFTKWKYNMKCENEAASSEAPQGCVICNAKTNRSYFNIYTTYTGSSHCLLSDFITKTSNIMFERDKVWSNNLCNVCLNLVNTLDSAQEKFLTLKNEFLVILNKNNNLTALCKRLAVCETQTEDLLPSKIEFCCTNVKHEFLDVSRGPSPLPVSDSDDEPLAKNKEKTTEKVHVPFQIFPQIKSELDVPEVEVKSESFMCRLCKLEFKTKALGAVHAFTVHRIDIAKDPDILQSVVVPEATKSTKESKKRKSKKKSKRKSYAELDVSDIEMEGDDKDWTIEAEIKPRTRGRPAGKVLKKPIHIKSTEEEDVKPTSEELQKKLSSPSLTIKKVGTHLIKPIKVKHLDGGKKNKDSVSNRFRSVNIKIKSGIDTEFKRLSKKSKEMLPCTECKATFSTKARLDYHMLKHAGSNSPFICEICGASYKHKKACDIHVGMHKGISPWKCSVCGKIFPSKGALSRHEAIHTGTPNYQCDLCGKSFIHTSSFKMHKLSHSGLKPHSCGKCGLALMTRSHLKRHQRVHSGEKRHECSTCGKKFSERYNLYAHQKSHDPSGSAVPRQMKNHDCTLCEATFNRRYILDKHMETAHQRIADSGPKRPRNTMTKLLKQQAMQQPTNSSQDSQTSVIDMIDVKIIVPPPVTPPLAHNTDSTSSTLIGESSFQPTGGPSTPAMPQPLVTKEEAADPPPPSLAWQGLYQLANDYPLRMHGVDYMGYLGRQ